MVPQGYGQQDRNGVRQQGRRTRQMAGAAVVARESRAGIPGVMLRLRTGGLRVVCMHVGAHGSRTSAMFMPIIAALHGLCSTGRMAAEWHGRRGPALSRQPGNQEQDNKAGRRHCAVQV